LKIVTGEDTNFRNHDGYYRIVILPQADKVGFTVPPKAMVSDAGLLQAFVNDGRWIVQCPDCNGAQPAFDGELLYMCHGCWNISTQHKWRRVTFPPDRVDIEGALEIRPLSQNRWWKPPETLQDLRDENSGHGLLILPRVR
jgi:hypothetical protein